MLPFVIAMSGAPAYALKEVKYFGNLLVSFLVKVISYSSNLSFEYCIQLVKWLVGQLVGRLIGRPQRYLSYLYSDPWWYNICNYVPLPRTITYFNILT